MDFEGSIHFESFVQKLSESIFEKDVLCMNSEDLVYVSARYANIDK